MMMTIILTYLNTIATGQSFLDPSTVLCLQSIGPKDAMGSKIMTTCCLLYSCHLVYYLHEDQTSNDSQA
jgi:hypothetical protein